MNGESLYPAVEVRLSGTDGNLFAVIGSVQRALREAGIGEGVQHPRDVGLAPSHQPSVSAAWCTAMCPPCRTWQPAARAACSRAVSMGR